MKLVAGPLRIVLTLLIAGLCGVMLVRYAPGFGTDERELDVHLRGESIASLRAVWRDACFTFCSRPDFTACGVAGPSNRRL